MDINDIMSLVKAGFMKQDIELLQNTAPPEPVPAPVPAPIDEQVAEPKPVYIPTPIPVPAPAPEPVQTAPEQEGQPSISDVLASIAKLTSAIQANAIAQSVMPQGISNPPTAEDMLAEIIRPTLKEGR